MGENGGSTDWAVIRCRIPQEDKDDFQERTDNISGRLRKMVSAWNEVEDQYGYDEEMKNMDIAVLKTYLNSIEKNISVLKQQRDKIKDELEKIEEEHDDVVVEINIDVEGLQY